MRAKPIDQSVVDARINEVRNEANGFNNSDNDLVGLVWIIQGLDLWHRSGGKMGHNLENTERYVLSRVIRMMHTLNDTENA